MGCTSTKNTNPPLFEPAGSEGVQRDVDLWTKIEKYNLDTQHFKFVISIQELLSELYGAFLLPDRVASLVLQFKKFMYLLAKNKRDSGNPLLPSPVIDRIWRILVSNSTLYRRFCEHVFGSFMHRQTISKPNIKNYHRTLEMYDQEFLQNNVEWPPYGSEESLSQSNNGFLYIRSAQFIDFHTEFSARYRGFSDFENLQKVYVQNMQQLRDKTKIKFKSDYGQLSKNRKPVPRVFTNSILQRKAEKEFDKEEEQYYNIKTHRMDTEEGTNKNFMRHFTVSVKLTSKQSEKNEKNIRARQQLIKLFSQINDQHAMSFVERRNSISSKDDNSKLMKSIADEDEELEKGRAKYDFKPLRQRWKESSVQQSKMQSYNIPEVIINIFASDFNTDIKLANNIFKEYKKFILLHRAGRTNKEFYYPRWIKFAWDYHMAETQEYEVFCNKVFGEFVDSVHFGRTITEEIMDKYEMTLYAYREVFEEEPNEQVWLSPDDEFDEDNNFSYKMFNVRGYMSEVINRIEAQVLAQKREMRETLEGKATERQQMRERKRAMAKMAVMSQPEKGSEHIHIGSATLQLYEAVLTQETEL